VTRSNAGASRERTAPARSRRCRSTSIICSHAANRAVLVSGWMRVVYEQSMSHLRPTGHTSKTSPCAATDQALSLRIRDTALVCRLRALGMFVIVAPAAGA